MELEPVDETWNVNGVGIGRRWASSPHVRLRERIRLLSGSGLLSPILWDPAAVQ